MRWSPCPPHTGKLGTPFAPPEPALRTAMLALATLSLSLTLLTGCLERAPAPPPVPSYPDLPVPPPPAPAPARTAEARLQLSAHRVPAGAPTVVVHSPEGLDPTRVDLVIYLHGWESCARRVVATGPVACTNGGPRAAGQGLALQHDLAGTNSVLVVPQLPWLARSGAPGRFNEPGFFQAWRRELVAGVLGPELGVPGPEVPGRTVLVAHSGGYNTALAILRGNGGAEISGIVLLDALYGGQDTFGDWLLAAGDRRLASLYTPHPGTTSRSLQLLARAGPTVGGRLLVAPTAAAHGEVPARELSTTLRWLDLAARVGAP